MQGLLDYPRQSLTTAQVTALLTGSSSIIWQYGAELLSPTRTVLSDISDNCTAASLKHDNDTTIQTDLTITMDTALNWGSDEIRLYVIGYDNSLVTPVPIRFDLGVYVVTTPGYDLGVTLPKYEVSGFDVMYYLKNEIGNTTTVASGSTIATAIASLMTAAGGYSLIFDSNVPADTAAGDRVYTLDSTHSWTFIEVINDLLASISHDPVWVDQAGNYHTRKTIPPVNRSPEFTVDSTVSPIIYDKDRNLTNDLFDAPNHWVFIQNGLTFDPIEGSGQYTVDILGGPTSQAAPPEGVGRVIRRVTFLDANSQTDLQTQGDALIAEAKRDHSVLKFKTGLIPIAGQADVLLFLDAALDGIAGRRLMARNWTMDLVDRSMAWECDTITA